MTSRVFISYRRDDSRWQAREIYRNLIRIVPVDNVFMDVESIPAGTDFPDFLLQKIGDADIVVVLIGHGFASKRLFDDNDFVRIEIRTALSLEKRIVPVLLDNASMPANSELPSDISGLASRNAPRIRFESVDRDVADVIGNLGLVGPKLPTPRSMFMTAGQLDNLVGELKKMKYGEQVLFAIGEALMEGGSFSAGRLVKTLSERGLYDSNRTNVDRDYEKARIMFDYIVDRTAALDQLGMNGTVNRSLLCLGRLYASGLGVPKDYSKARHLFLLAAQRDRFSTLAQDELEKLPAQ